MCVGSCLATKVFIGNLLPATGRVWIIISRPVMNGGQLPTNQLHDINWGALDYASCAPQLMSCNYACVCARVCMRACMCVCVCVQLYMYMHVL